MDVRALLADGEAAGERQDERADLGEQRAQRRGGANVRIGERVEQRVEELLRADALAEQQQLLVPLPRTSVHIYIKCVCVCLIVCDLLTFGYVIVGLQRFLTHVPVSASSVNIKKLKFLTDKI